MVKKKIEKEVKKVKAPKVKKDKDNQVKVETRGRPIVHDREKLAEKLVAWSLRDDSINLNAFCSEECIVPQNVLRYREESELFRLAYELAKARIAVRREKRISDGTLHVKAYDLNATVYDAFLRDERRAQAEYEANLNKVKVDIPPLDNILELQNEMMRLKAENEILKKKIDAV